MIGSFIYQNRIRINESQRGLAKRLEQWGYKTDQTSISWWEREKGKPPIGNPVFVEALAHVFELDVQRINEMIASPVLKADVPIAPTLDIPAVGEVFVLCRPTLYGKAIAGNDKFSKAIVICSASAEDVTLEWSVALIATAPSFARVDEMAALAALELAQPNWRIHDTVHKIINPQLENLI